MNPASVGLDRAGVESAYARIKPHVRRTPVLDLSGEPDVPGRVLLKLELLQHTGSFKARGAVNNVLSLPDGAAGVCAASGGNHAAAVAYAAGAAGLQADVFAPRAATPAKLDRIREYGARLHLVDGHVGEALDACREFGDTHAVPMIHPYDSVPTACGAGTLGLELAEQVPDADLVVLACGGGGLFAGVSAALDVPVQPVEPELCAHLAGALEAGTPVDLPSGGAAADSLGPPRIGTLAFETAIAHGTRPVLVTEELIAAARRFLWQRVRVLAEPGACVGLAAVLAGRIDVRPGGRTVVVVSGGNNATLP
jgi:threonine dehydratase